MKLKKLFTIASAALLMAACTSNVSKEEHQITWAEFSSDETITQEYSEVSTNILAKVITNGNDQTITMHHTLSCNVKVETLKDSVIVEKQQDFNLALLCEQDYSLAKYFKENLSKGGEVVLYLTSGAAIQLDLAKDGTYQILKATVDCMDATDPEWEVVAKGTAVKLEKGMSISRVLSLIGNYSDVSSKNEGLVAYWRGQHVEYALTFVHLELAKIKKNEVE
jgi:hypothetical protein